MLLLKVITWRLISIILTVGVMVVATGDVKEATAITIVLHALLTIVNYGFEKGWEKINENR
jgi:uncharacterized membrane protein